MMDADIEQKYNKLREAVKELSIAITENRSDISEILMDIADGKDLDKTMIEHRFIECDVPQGATSALYDTLRTIIEFQMPDGTWQDGHNHEYKP